MGDDTSGEGTDFGYTYNLVLVENLHSVSI